MDYVWGMYVVCMMWRIEYLWNTYGVTMEYDVAYGVPMECL